MARRTALLDEQPSLWDDPQPAPPPTPEPPTKPTKRSNRHHRLELPRPWSSPLPCISSCLVCARPDGLGVCEHGCSVVRGRPDKTGPVEICLITLTLPARTIGRFAVVSCPHCDGTHWHQPTPGRRFRVGQCGQPYIVHTPTT